METDLYSSNFNTAFEVGWTGRTLQLGKGWIEACTNIHKFVHIQVHRSLQETNESPRGKLTGISHRDRYMIFDKLAKHVRDSVQLRYQVLKVFLPP